MRLAIFALAFSMFAAEAPKVKPEQVALTPAQLQTVQALNIRAAQLQKEQADFERAMIAERKVLQMEYERFLDQQCRAAGGDACAVKTVDEGGPLPPDKWALVISKKPPEVAKGESK